jgi:hypothetical protein
LRVLQRRNKDSVAAARARPATPPAQLGRDDAAAQRDTDNSRLGKPVFLGSPSAPQHLCRWR